MKTKAEKILFLIAVALCSLGRVEAQDVYAPFRESWMVKAEQYKPELNTVQVQPKNIVKVTKDEEAYQGYGTEIISDISRFYETPLKEQGKEWVVDFGEHRVGKISMFIEPDNALHAPLQVKVKFGEMPLEIATPFSSYSGGLSKAWLQEEIITIHVLPDTIYLPARYAFRYMKIELLASASDLDFKIKDITCHSTSSAGKDMMPPKGALPKMFTKIDQVSLKTLQDCMQTVFEDGPKRDRRIWIGDFKLQALANYYSFQNVELVKRGLYLYAATASEDGLVYGTLFEKPQPHPQKHFPIDYLMLYNTMLNDYFEFSGDTETVNDLWAVAKQQTLNIIPYISDNGIFNKPENSWVFIDWNEQLDKQTSLQGVIIYSLEKTWELAKILNKENELSMLPKLIKKMKAGAKKNLFDKGSGLFQSGDIKQVSLASQVWMILSGTVSPEEGAKLLKRVEGQNNVLQPVSPYMFHYVVEAMITCGMYDEAKNLLSDYWGEMVNKGADTFWEVYDPGNDLLSPYNSAIINSYCHAWSCTPLYFIRKYEKELFQR